MLPTPLYEASLAFLGHGDLRIRCSAYKRFSPATEENRRKPRFSQLCYGSAADFETPNSPQNQSPSAFEPTPKADRFSRTPHSTAGTRTGSLANRANNSAAPRASDNLRFASLLPASQQATSCANLPALSAGPLLDLNQISKLSYLPLP